MNHHETASELAESWYNGNRSAVLDTIEGLPRWDAIAVVALIPTYLASDPYPMAEAATKFINALVTRVESHRTRRR